MGAYDQHTPEQLRALLGECGLSTAGNKPQMIKRLERFQGGGTVSWDNPPIAGAVVDPARAGAPLPGVPIGEARGPQPTEGYQQQLGVYWVMHPVDPGGLSDDQHRKLLVDTVRRAEAAGHTVRGGLYAGRRTSYVERDDQLHVCYEVSVRRI